MSGVPAPSGTHDVIVVGGGTAGSLLAARLTTAGRRVLVLEAGAAPLAAANFPADLLDGGRVLGAAPGHPANWAYPAVLAPGRPYSIARGRILGGSSTINGGYLIRPRDADLTRWAAVGGASWAPDAALAVMRRLERDLDFGSTALHGDAGPVPIRRTSVTHPAAAGFVAAATATGALAEPDKNGAQVAGIGPVPSNVIDGTRWNAALAALLPALASGRLEVRGETAVDRILVAGGRAIGVEIAGERVLAGEVVLAAGVVASPRLLAASGLDARNEATFADHPQIVVEWRPRGTLPVPTDAWLTAALHVEDGDATVEILQSTVPMPALIGLPVGAESPLPFLVSALDPHARHGRLRLDGPLLLDYGYLSSARERALLRLGVRRLAELVAHPDLDGELVDLDAATLASDRDLDAWIRARLGTSIHGCGTLPMGELVDGAGRVRDIAGLRVADTSMLPTAPTRGPAYSALLIGELVADTMLA